jgi:hypothetical protein
MGDRLRAEGIKVPIFGYLVGILMGKNLDS